MLIKYLGTGDSPRSFIETLQRYVSVGEIVQVRNSIAAGLLAGGRWRKISEIPANSTPSPSRRPTARKRSRRAAVASSAAATAPPPPPPSRPAAQTPNSHPTTVKVTP